LKADYFFIDTKDQILYDGANINYPNTFRHGLELELKTEFFDVIEAFLNYTYQRATFEHGNHSGKNIPLVPRNKLSFGFHLKPTEGININLICNYVGQRVALSDLDNNGPRLKGYFTTDLNIMFKVKEISIAGSVKNMFDKEYFSNGAYYGDGADSYYPAPERRFELTVSAKF